MEKPSIEAMIAGATLRPTSAEEALASVPTRYLTKAPLVTAVDREGTKFRGSTNELLRLHHP